MRLKILMISFCLLFPFLTIQSQVKNKNPITFKIGVPNCNPLAEKYDNPLIGVGWTMPRVGWHIMYPSITMGIAKGLDYVSRNKIPPFITSSIATFGVGLLPHIRGGIIRRDYPIDLMDWSYDLWNHSLPSWSYLSNRENSKKDYLIYLGGDLVLSCFAHP